MKKGNKIIAIILVIATLIYVVNAIYLLIINPTNTYIVRQGTLSEEEENIGYIIRDEVIVKEEGNNNGIFAIASEGQRVAVGEPIFRYYSDSEKQIKTQIRELNYKIQDVLLKQEDLEPSADIKSIEKQIEDKLQNMNTLTNYQEIVENKKNVDNLITKKINFIGDITENKEIKDLIQQRNSLENQLKNGAEYKIAERAGVVSYRVDGFEEKLSVDKFNEITENYLNKLDLKTGKLVIANNECGKVIDNFKSYVAITTKTKKGMSAKVGDSVALRISNNEEYKAKVFQINEESGKRTIIFKINNISEDIINHRKIVVDVIWNEASGLKVPKQALIQENGLYYVMRNKAGIISKLLVKVEMQTDKFAIIEPYKDSELEEIGYNTKQIEEYKRTKISNYDEIIINQ